MKAAQENAGDYRESTRMKALALHVTNSGSIPVPHGTLSIFRYSPEGSQQLSDSCWPCRARAAQYPQLLTLNYQPYWLRIGLRNPGPPKHLLGHPPTPNTCE